MEKFGFDDAFNYKKEPDIDAALKRYLEETKIIYHELQIKNMIMVIAFPRNLKISSLTFLTGAFLKALISISRM